MNKIRHRIEWLFTYIALAAVRALPHRLAQKLGGRLGLIAHDWLGIRKLIARKQLSEAFPDKDDIWVNRNVRNVYRNFGMLAAEMARIPVMPLKKLKKWMVVEGEEYCWNALDATKGCIIISGHIGNWEMAGAWLARHNYPINFVVAEQTNVLIDKMMDKQRRSAGIGIIKRSVAPRGIMKVLGNNGVVALMIDQDARRAGVFVPFFGKMASTPRGVALYALKYNPKMVFLSSWRDSKGVIHVKFEPIEYIPDGNREENLLKLTTILTEHLENIIREHPDQWLWLHRRWKTRPENES